MNKAFCYLTGILVLAGVALNANAEIDLNVGANSVAKIGESNQFFSDWVLSDYNINIKAATSTQLENVVFSV